MSDTNQYYSNNLEEFVTRTSQIDMSEIYGRFLPLLKSGCHILDAGCGAGRDTRFFIDSGFQVSAFDQNEKLCDFAAKNTGIDVKLMTFLELGEKDTFDAIWACASLLHLDKNQLNQALDKLINSLKSGGYFYCSFKNGTFSGYRDGRFYQDMTLEKLKKTLSGLNLKLIDLWENKDQSTEWVNAICQKN